MEEAHTVPGDLLPGLLRDGASVVCVSGSWSGWRGFALRASDGAPGAVLVRPDDGQVVDVINVDRDADLHIDLAAASGWDAAVACLATAIWPNGLAPHERAVFGWSSSRRGWAIWCDTQRGGRSWPDLGIDRTKPLQALQLVVRLFAGGE